VKLQSLTLKNFQAHKDLDVQFSPTLTTIKGATDAGKSAVLRALRWVCLNDIAGADFIREGAKQVTVTLEVTSNLEVPSTFEIARSKKADATRNTYALDGHEYKAFGQSVPSDIATTLALNKINFQGQHDPPFWFSDTAGEVSRQLNSVIDLSIIDSALANIASAVRVSQERKSICEERLAEAKRQLEELASQKERIENFKALKESRDWAIATADSWIRLRAIVDQIESNQADQLAQKAVDGIRLLETMLAVRRAQRNAEGLNDIVFQIAEQRARATPPPIFSEVKQAFTEVLARSEYAERLETLVVAAIEKQNELVLCDADAKRAEAIFHGETKGKRCPLCQNLIR
jgi:DNA repair ATPase RecN